VAIAKGLFQQLAQLEPPSLRIGISAIIRQFTDPTYLITANQWKFVIPIVFVLII
jgi:hypothetical protein